MRILYSAILSILAVLPFTARATAAEPTTRAASQSDPWHAARIQVDLGGGRHAIGSGTPIACERGRTYVLTNAHVCESALHPVTVTVGGRTYRAHYEEGSPVTHVGPGQIHVDGPDLCLLSIGAELDHVRIADTTPPEGASVWQCGYGGGGERPALKHGRVTGNRHVEPTLTSTILTIQGDSGSGVFNERGELVGVTWGGGEGTACAVEIHTVKRFLLRDRLRALFPRLALRLSAKRILPGLPVPDVMPPRSIPVAPSCPVGGCQAPVYWPQQRVGPVRGFFRR